MDFILKEIGSHGMFVSRGRLMFRMAFQKDLCGCRMENGLNSVKYMEVRAFVSLIPESYRHCLNSEPLSLWPNISLSPRMLLMKNLGILRTLPRWEPGDLQLISS